MSKTNGFFCSYPKCPHREKAEYCCMLEVTNERGASVNLPFCKYHYFIVNGGHFVARKNHQDGEEWDFSLEGPFEKIALIEQVVAAVEMVRPESEDKKT